MYNLRKILIVIFIFGIFNVLQSQNESHNYQPTFESLNKANPVPEWFMDAKFGIYFHWGVYSVPAYGSEWYPRSMYLKGTPENMHHVQNYGEATEWPYNNFITGAKDLKGNFMKFAPKLKSEGGKFDPEEWAQLFADAGAKFAGPVAEHHDGFSMWASEVNPWNAKDMGPNLDLVGLFTDAIRKRNMKIILSMHHAFNITGYYQAVPKTDDPKLQMLFGQMGKEKNESVWLIKHKEIIDKYKPDIIWQDFNLHQISQSKLLGFLSYYYNQSQKWGKEVVATFKDGLNTDCAVLDYERGGPPDITENYWLTDDAISSSSWSYTEGIGYYSVKQVLHGFLDRISKNGNLLLNISPKADGTIPVEQKEILLAMGSWLKKYGESVYATRAWQRYGEGPTEMGSGHGIFTAPAEGTSKDVRYTRSKDNSTLYAILLGREADENQINLKSLSSDRIDLKDMKSVELINGKAGSYLPLYYEQTEAGLLIKLPEKRFDEMAYVLKLNFNNQIPPYNNYAVLNTELHYHIIPSNSRGELVIGNDFKLTNDKKNLSNQWDLQFIGGGYYKIANRGNDHNVVSLNMNNNTLEIASFQGKDSQFWKIDDAYNGLITISSKQNPDMFLSISNKVENNSTVEVKKSNQGNLRKWKLVEVCELEQKPYIIHNIPGVIEAEHFDMGCPGDAYYDSDEINEGRPYREALGVDLDTCNAGSYTLGWTNKGEWLEYTINVNKTKDYNITFYTATTSDYAKFRIEVDNSKNSLDVSLSSTGGYQNWTTTTKLINLSEGEHILKFVVVNGPFNLDKMVIEEAK